MSQIRRLIAFGGAALLVAATVLVLARSVPDAQVAPRPASSAAPSLSVASMPRTTLAVPSFGADSVISVEAHDRLWEPFVYFGPVIGLRDAPRSIEEVTESSDLVVRG